MMSGEFAAALRTADQLVTAATAALPQMPMLEPFAAKKAYVLMRFARWDEVLKLPAPDQKFAVLTLLSHFSRGVAHAALGHNADAERERAAYVEARKALPPDSDWGFNKASTIMAITDAVLDARIAWARDEKPAAIDAWTRAVAAEDALHYDEPPDWFYPTRESLGAALSLAGRHEEAEQVFRADLAVNPRNPRSLFGLAQALTAQRKPDAATVERQFRDAWKLADVKLRLEEF
jgi:tetratricopeptide (TPR) repeat protein